MAARPSGWTARLQRPISSTRADRRVLAVAVVVTLLFAGYVAKERFGLSTHVVRLWATERLEPHTWPRQRFSKELWASTAPGGRYVFAKDLRARLPGLSRSEVATLLGGHIRDDSFYWPIRRAHEINLWFVLYVSFEADRAQDVRVRLAWLDP